MEQERIPGGGENKAVAVATTTSSSRGTGKQPLPWHAQSPAESWQAAAQAFRGTRRGLGHSQGKSGDSEETGVPRGSPLPWAAGSISRGLKISVPLLRERAESPALLTLAAGQNPGGRQGKHLLRNLVDGLTF